MGSWLAGSGRTSRVIVIDDSLSMGYRADGRAGFDRAKDAARQLVSVIGAQDSVSVLTTSAMDVPLVKEAHLEDPKKVAALVDNLSATDTSSDWPATFRALDPLLGSATDALGQRPFVLLRVRMPALLHGADPKRRPPRRARARR